MLNQIVPGAVTASNGLPKTAAAKSKSEDGADTAFAAELAGTGEAAEKGEAETILTGAQETANPPLEESALPEIPVAANDDEVVPDSEPSVNPPQDALPPLPPEAAVSAPPAGETDEVSSAAASKATEEIPAPEAGADSKPAKAGLLADRAEHHRGQTSQPQPQRAAEPAQPAPAAPAETGQPVKTSAETSEPAIETENQPAATGVSDTDAAPEDEAAANQPPRRGNGKPMLEAGERPGRVPEFAAAAATEGTPKAWGLRADGKSGAPVKSGETIQAETAPDGKARTAASAEGPAGARAETADINRPQPANIKPPLLKSASATAGLDFTLPPAGQDEAASGGGASETGLNAAAAKPAPITAATTTAAAGARLPSLPIQNIAVEIGHHFQAGQNRFRIKLDPPELGRIDVRLSISRDGHVSSHMAVDKPETLAALNRDAGALERALNTAGLDTDKNSLNFSLRQGNQGFERGGEAESGAQTGGGSAGAEDGEVMVPEQVYRGYVNAAGVDLHV